MKTTHDGEPSNSFNHAVVDMISHWFFREKKPAMVFGYINPWHAAMEDFIDHAEFKARSNRKRPSKRKIERPENRRPALRL